MTDSPLSTALVIAQRPSDAELAAPFLDGDAIIEIADNRSATPETRFGLVVISGDRSNSSWLTAALARAGATLRPGGRVLIVLSRRPAGSEPPDAFTPTALAEALAPSWRLVAVHAELPNFAAVIARAADADRANAARDVRFAELMEWLYARPDVLATIDERVGRAAWAIAPDPDTSRHLHVDELRRQLDAYRSSPLGRLTTTYWRWIGRLRRRRGTATPQPAGSPDARTDGAQREPV